MNNIIYINDIKTEKNKIDYEYTVKGDWKKYFKLSEKFFIEYSENIFEVSKSISAIPLLCNILPIAWLCNAKIFIDELDKDFFESIRDFKKGYINMYPMLSFDGDLIISKLVDNTYNQENKTAMFFSGGVDSFFSLISHIRKKPSLVTIWGSDIFFNDIEGWNNVKDQVLATSGKINVNYVFIKSCFRLFLEEKSLNELVEKSKDKWWHGFQHGIGLIGHVAPYAYKKKLKTVYIASSFTIEDKGNITCASDPTIDNCLRFCGCKIVHDGYQLSRQEKIKKICEFAEKNKIKIDLRVCWVSKGGRNCCKCEKCYRTILGIIAEGYNYENFGFNNVDFKKIENDVKEKIHFDNIMIAYWKGIQKRYVNRKNNFDVSKELDWLVKINFKKINNKPKKVIREYLKKIRSIAKNATSHG